MQLCGRKVHTPIIQACRKVINITNNTGQKKNECPRVFFAPLATRLKDGVADQLAGLFTLVLTVQRHLPDQFFLGPIPCSEIKVTCNHKLFVISQEYFRM